MCALPNAGVHLSAGCGSLLIAFSISMLERRARVEGFSRDTHKQTPREKRVLQTDRQVCAYKLTSARGHKQRQGWCIGNSLFAALVSRYVWTCY